MNDFFMKKGAVISQCGDYLYQLWRRWDLEKPRQVWIMLNPSTADAEEDDPTICRLIKRAQQTGFGGITVFNLYAFRATSPKDLWKSQNTVGPENYQYLMNCGTFALIPEGGQIVCAWGNNAHREMVEWTKEYLAYDMGLNLYCLDVSKKGQPVHPLYQPLSKKPRLWLNRELWLKS